MGVEMEDFRTGWELEPFVNGMDLVLLSLIMKSNAIPLWPTFWACILCCSSPGLNNYREINK